MARGKQANAAVARRERQAVETELDVGRRKIRDLLRENAEKQDQINRLHAQHSEEMRRMRIALAELAAPQVLALTSQLEEQRERNRGFKQRVSDIQKRWDSMCLNVHGHFYTEHGMTGPEAMEAVMTMVTGLRIEELPVLEDPEAMSTNVPVDRIIAIQRARGRRRPGSDGERVASLTSISVDELARPS